MKDEITVRHTSHATWHTSLVTYLALGAILLLAVVLHFFRLDQEGYANLYYAATVKSMLTSWHAFFFASFDPGGFVTVDKPPLGFWVQAASATLFGFSGTSLLLPQALAGVLSVALLYHLVRRVFGTTAGLLAALTLAVTPISIAANRNNTMDSLLVLTLLLSAWAVSRAVEKGRLRWLLLCAILLGIGFNIKMLQAFMVLPAFWLVYLIAAQTAWWKRILHLSLATMVLLVVSLAWVVVVDWTPADQRPFVGSSRNNTEMELIVGHNGLARLGSIASWLGLRGPGAPANAPAGNPSGQPPSGAPPSGQLDPPPPGNQPGAPPSQPNQPSPPGGLNDETGQPGALRLFNKQLAGQISWLLPLAALGFLVAGLQTRLRYPLAREHQQLLLWGAWLAPQVVFFSFAGLFHRYYLEMLSPAIAALVGIGVVAMWKIYSQHRWRGLILPIAIVLSAAVEAVILSYFSDWNGWLMPTIGIASGIAAIALVVLKLVKPPIAILHSTIAATGILILLIAPTLWAITPLLGADTGLPFAGPELLSRPSRPNIPTDNPLTDYLRANRQGARFLAATLSAQTAAPLILATGEPVMALGGFGGNDQILSKDQLAQLVANNTVRLFWLSAQTNQQAELTRWVTSNCANVTASLRQAPSPGRGNAPNPAPGGAEQLYDCARRR